MKLLPLQPFGGGAAGSSTGRELQLEAGVNLAGQRLELRYRLQGRLGALLIPEPVEPRERRDELWQATCFEAFVAMEGSDPYWELNLSPAGHWNLYRLDGYRRGLQPEPRCPSLTAEITKGPDQLQLALTLDLAPLVPAATPLELALTAVLQERDGRCSYWALRHPAPEADFHHRGGFLPLAALEDGDAAALVPQKVPPN